MESKFDDELNKMLNEEVNIPQKITNKIRSSLEEKRKGVYVGMKLNKVVATIVGIIIMSTVAVFAGKAIIEMEKRKVVDIAQDNGYFEKVDMDYVYDAGIGVKIEKYFIDQGRVGITINIHAEEEIDYAEIYSTDIKESGTYSEEINGNTYIHFDESEIGKEYNRRFDIIRFIDENGNEVRFDEDSIGGRGADMPKFENIDNNTIRGLCEKVLYQEVTTNKMKITIKRIILYKDGNKKEYVGNWNFEVNIAEKYLNHSNTIKYQGTVNLPNVVVEKATLSATKLVVTLKTENLNKLLYGTDNKLIYERPRLYGEAGEYDSGIINTEQSNYYDKNEMVLKFDISKFNAEDIYKIILDGGMEITLTKDN